MAEIQLSLTFKSHLLQCSMIEHMDPKELKLILEISRNGNTTQRNLSKRTNLSLGLVNLILKRLVKRGYIKSRELDVKKAEYILTPKGFAEKTKKSYAYIFKTIDMVKNIKEEIKRIILKEYKKGARDFVVLGEGSLTDLVRLAFSENRFDNMQYRFLKKPEWIEKEELVLITDEQIKKVNGNRVINLAEDLTNVYWGIE